MKNVNVIDIKPGSNITDFFMIKATSIKVGSNGKEYHDLTLTGFIVGGIEEVSDIANYKVSKPDVSCRSG